MFRIQYSSFKFLRTAFSRTYSMPASSYSIRRISLNTACKLPYRVYCKNFSSKNDETDEVVTNEKSINSFSDVPGVKTSVDTYTMVFTCSVCSTRSAKKISKQGYHHGVVIVRCPGCQNKHLIADHLGVFEDKGWDIEKFLSETGPGVKRISEDEGVLELNAEDILGATSKK